MLLWMLAVCCLVAQDARLSRIKSVYIVPSDMSGTVKQLEERIPEQLSWKVVHDPRQADALIGISESESVAGYWIYEGPGSLSATATQGAGRVAYMNGTVTPGTSMVTTLRKRYGHVVIYDVRTAELLYNYTTRLRFLWSNLTGGFLKDVRKQMDRMSRVGADSAIDTVAADEHEPGEPDFDFSRYASLDELDGHAWNDLPDPVKVGYLIGYAVALNVMERSLRSAFGDVAPPTAVSPLLASSRTERSKREGAQSVIEQRTLAIVEASQVKEPMDRLLARLEEFYGEDQNLDVPVLKALVLVRDRESAR